MTNVLDAFPPHPDSEEPLECAGGRGGPAGSQARGRAREIVVDTHSDGKRRSRSERIGRERLAREQGLDVPADGWAAASLDWGDLKAFVLHLPPEREAQAWAVVIAALETLGDELRRQFGDGGAV